jgi:glyoxylase-like metal-dependent hydrolase (beta-lactamase superfamily II)
MDEIHYPLEDTLPQTGELVEVAQGVFWLRMPLPFALDHINLWLLRDTFEGKEGWTIVDCGISTPVIQAAWESIFANHLQGLPIVRVIATHMHPDHIGLAHWLCKTWQVPLWMSMTDFLLAKWWSSKEGGQNLGSEAGGGGAADHFFKHGLTDEKDLEVIRGRSSYFSNLVPDVPKQFRRLMDQEELQIGNRTWRAISGFGHSPEHLAFACIQDKLMIAGDMLLPRISTNISVHDMEPDADPLGQFLDSIAKFEFLDPLTLVLPSHGKPFQGLHFRVQQLRDHHDERLKETWDACIEPQTAKDILPILFRRKLDMHQMTFAMGEAVAHLNYLWRRGKLKREADERGILRFSRQESVSA